jgi:plastocyanin
MHVRAQVVARLPPEPQQTARLRLLAARLRHRALLPEGRPGILGRVALTLAAVAAAAAIPGQASAHPGHSALVSVGDGKYTPSTIKITAGHRLTWWWDWPDLDHTVTADPGQAESFDSDPDGTPDHALFDTYAHRFTVPGTYTYFCRVHPDTMTGAVQVVPVPTSPPPEPDGESPAGGTALTLSGLRVGPRRRRAAFTVSYASTVTAQLDRRRLGAWRPVRRFELAAAAGLNRVRLRARPLPPGRYRVRMSARDGAGNRSGALLVRFRVEPR